jgi:hypothetical protein
VCFFASLLTRLTLHPQVTQIARVAMRDSFEIVDTVGEDAEATVHRASQVCASPSPLMFAHRASSTIAHAFLSRPFPPRPCWCAI